MYILILELAKIRTNLALCIAVAGYTADYNRVKISGIKRTKTDNLSKRKSPHLKSEEI